MSSWRLWRWLLQSSGMRHRVVWYKSAEFFSIVKPTRCTNVSTYFYFWRTLYLFRTVFPSVIRISRLYRLRLIYTGCDCNEWKTEKRHECAKMGEVKRLELWWQLYRTSLPVRDLENFRPMDFCSTECTYSNRHISNRYCCLLASRHSAVSVWHMPVAVFTFLISWWWTERPFETCRVSFQNKINLIHWCILFNLL